MSHACPALPHTQGSDVVFAKSYRGGVLLTIIWYGPAGSYYVSLSPATGEEQALVDTLFPSIYGKRRGLALQDYDTRGAVYDGETDVATALATGTGSSSSGGGSDSKEADGVLPACRLFSCVSVWEANEPVPDPDAVRERDELESALAEALATAVLLAPTQGAAAAAAAASAGAADDDDDDDDGSTASDADADADGDQDDGGAVVDVSGGSGYTQVYLVLKPTATGTTGSGGASVVPREAVFRFGDWIYSGAVDFPVDALKLGDVPHVLPALQKQQGRLSFLSEATKMPVGAWGACKEHKGEGEGEGAPAQAGAQGARAHGCTVDVSARRRLHRAISALPSLLLALPALWSLLPVLRAVSVRALQATT